MTDLLLFGNVGEPPLCNTRFAPLRAFQKAFRTTLIEPRRFHASAATGAPRPATVPDEAVIEHTDPPPDVVVCFGDALHLSERAARMLPRETALVGFALADPYGLSASLSIAPRFDLFYTQDPQTLSAYAARGVAARRCDPAADPELDRPERAEPDCDLLYFGRWTPWRDELVAALAERFRVRLHRHVGETRWSTPALPPLDTPELLRAGIHRARLVLETARLDDAPGKFRDTFHITPRAMLAAACGVPTLVESFATLTEFFEAGRETAAFVSKADLLDQAAHLLGDESARSAMGRRARQRVLRQHTWDQRVETVVLDFECVEETTPAASSPLKRTTPIAISGAPKAERSLFEPDRGSKGISRCARDDKWLGMTDRDDRKRSGSERSGEVA